jgi:two-component system sensor kinase FixL
MRNARGDRDSGGPVRARVRRLQAARGCVGREHVDACEREQRRIGRDLHDELGQRLAGMSYLSHQLAVMLEARALPEAGNAARLGALASETLGIMRALARGLDPPDLAHDGLTAALERLARHTTEMFPAACLFEAPDCAVCPGKDVALHLFRIAQEAVTNAVRHGMATMVRISLKAGGGCLLLSIADNGSGMRKPDHADEGMGLRIMRCRAEAIGARLEWIHPEEGGVVVICGISAGS